jgi:4-amino-4-deoxy-L-arabinose transferase-like glycosyltransferase
VTGFLDSVFAGLIALLLNMIVVRQIRHRLPLEEGSFLARLYVWTLALRYGLAVILNQYAADSAFAGLFWGDSGTYDIGGYLLAQQWSGEPYLTSPATRFISGYGFIYFVAAVYFVFGRNQLLVQFLNGTLGALSVVVLYAIARELFGTRVARYAALFMAFFPQMIFWSGAMYKDPAVLLCIAASIYAVLRLRAVFSPAMLILFLVSALALMTLRFYVFYFVAFSTVATFIFAQHRGGLRRVLAYGILVAALFGAFRLAIRQETAEQQESFLTLERLQITRADQAMWGKSGFGTEYNVSTFGGALQALPTGLAYLLFAPFPWSISGLRQALVLPEMLVWYALMPAFVRGLAHTVRRRLRDVLPILVFAGTLTAGYALFQGNVGTAYRQRTQVTMFFFVFMGVGLVEKERRRLRQMPLGEPTPVRLP